jgi:hypothetical protein
MIILKFKRLLRYLVLLRDKGGGGGLVENMNSGIDRACQDLTVTIIGYIGTSPRANPGRYFSKLCAF